MLDLMKGIFFGLDATGSHILNRDLGNWMGKDQWRRRERRMNRRRRRMSWP